MRPRQASTAASRQPGSSKAEHLNAQLERRVEQRTAELRAAYAELEAFAYSVSHDLRAPLINIGGFVDLLLTRSADRLDEQSRHYLRTIAESTYQMGRMIDEVLALSRMSGAEMQKTRFALAELVREVVLDLGPISEARTIDWVVNPLPEVEANPTLLRQAVFNLLSNAVKFTSLRKEARIEIWAQQGDGETIFSVRDNGIGFDMKQKHKLFGVFQRLHTAAVFEGAGVGLTHVRRIILRHGGRTWAEGEVDRGATFYFSLPNPGFGPT